jgi:hypothetical protein
MVYPQKTTETLTFDNLAVFFNLLGFFFTSLGFYLKLLHFQITNTVSTKHAISSLHVVKFRVIHNLSAIYFL